MDRKYLVADPQKALLFHSPQPLDGLQGEAAVVAGVGAGMFLLNLAILGFAGYGVYKFATKKKHK